VSFTLYGIGVSRGIAIGPVHIIRPQVEINEYQIEVAQVENEIGRYKTALERAREELRQVRDQIPLIYPAREPVEQPDVNNISATAAEIASFIDPHMLMLEDAMLTQIPIEIIKDQRCNAEWALKQQQDRFIELFEAMDNEYLKARKHDIQQVIERVQRCLLQAAQPNNETEQGNEQNYPEGSVILADDLTPADTAMMPHRGIKAFITEHGGTNSHTAIIARSLGIPAIVGVRRARHYLRRGDTLVVDGLRGALVSNPDVRSLRFFKSLQSEQKRRRSELARLREAPAVTQDGQLITLYANIEFPSDTQAVNRTGANGIGLYRTEFLHMNRGDHSQPDEEEHYEAYVSVLRAVEGPVTIRTLDLGADKQVDGGIAHTSAVTANPALGLRGVRLCLQDLDLFKPQLRAILRASVIGPVRVMIPMVSSVQEVMQVRQLIKDVQRELDIENHAYDVDIPVGVMVEVPSMAICSNIFLPHVDFLSIGTNDLIQYTLAIDRVDDEVGYLYDPMHPAVLHLLHTVINHSNQANKPVSMCGEMAGDGRYVRLLLGMGLHYFSVNPETLLEVKHIIRHSDLSKLRPLAEQILQCHDSKEIETMLTQINSV